MTANHLAISLHALPERVWAIRNFVEAYYRVVLVDADLVDRIAMATHELMENAAKYASSDESQLRIAYSPENEPPALEIAVTSRIDPRDVGPLSRLMERLEAAEDVQALYIEMIRESAKRDNGSGLGLIRIRAEGEMTLKMETHDDHVCIRASAVAAVNQER